MNNMIKNNIWTIFNLLLLFAVAIGSSGALFGIWEINGARDIPSFQQKETPENTTEVNKTDLDAFYYILNESRERDLHNVTYVETSIEKNTLIVYHEIDKNASQPRAKAVGVMSEVFAGSLKSGWEIQKMEGHVVSDDGTVVMTYYVKRAWALSRTRDRMSPEMYANLIHSTQDVKQPTVTAPG